MGVRDFLTLVPDQDKGLKLPDHVLLSLAKVPSV